MAITDADEQSKMPGFRLPEEGTVLRARYRLEIVKGGADKENNGEYLNAIFKTCGENMGDREARALWNSALNVVERDFNELIEGMRSDVKYNRKLGLEDQIERHATALKLLDIYEKERIKPRADYYDNGGEGLKRATVSDTAEIRHRIGQFYEQVALTYESASKLAPEKEGKEQLADAVKKKEEAIKWYDLSNWKGMIDKTRCEESVKEMKAELATGKKAALVK